MTFEEWNEKTCTGASPESALRRCWQYARAGMVSVDDVCEAAHKHCKEWHGVSTACCCNTLVAALRKLAGNEEDAKWNQPKGKP